MYNQPNIRRVPYYEKSVPKQSIPNSYQNFNQYGFNDFLDRTPDKKQNVQYSKTGTGFGRINYVTQSRPNNEDETLKEFKRTASQNQLFLNTGNYVKRKNEDMVSNLKSQLQTLKLEVNKIINKQPDQIRPLTRQSSRGAYEVNNYGNPIISSFKEKEKHEKEQNQSVTSERLIDQPINQLSKKAQAMNYDHGHYMELQNNLLKTELRNLKNKYNSKKIQLNEKCEALQKKNQYLEVTLQKSQKTLSQFKSTLDVEIHQIKSQMARKLESQRKYEQQKIQNVTKISPFSHDNELIQQKLRKLYDQIKEKNKLINNFNLQLNEINNLKDKINYELRKQKQINSEITKQLQLAKRQISRNQQYLQAEVVKKNQYKKNLDQLKEKNFQLTKEIDLKTKQVYGASEHQITIIHDIQRYKQSQIQFKSKIHQLQNKLKKNSQLNEADKIQIEYLKKSNEECRKQIENYSKNLKIQGEKSLQNEQNFRSLIDTLKKKEEQKITMLRNQFQNNQNKVKQNSKVNLVKLESNDQNSKEKDMQIKKWKAQYKLLKMKMQEKEKYENQKKNQIETYYKGYIQYKHRVQELQAKNKALEKQLNQSIEKTKKIEIQLMNCKSGLKRQCKNLEVQLSRSTKQLNDLKEEEELLKKKLEEQIQKRQEENDYRRGIEKKVFQLSIDDEKQLNEILDKIQKRVNEQDQKLNKLVKEIKNKDNLISKLRKQIRELMESKQKQLLQIRQRQIQQITKDLLQKKFIFVEEVKISSKRDVDIEKEKYSKLSEENGGIKGRISFFQENILKLKQQNQNILHLYNSKVLQAKIQAEKFINQKNIHQQRYQQLRIQKNNQQKSYSEEIKIKNQQITSLREQIQLLQNQKITKRTFTNFQDALKDQIQQIEKLKAQINKKNQEVYKIRDSYTSLRNQYDNMKSQVQMTKLKIIAEKKNTQVTYEVQIQNLKNKISIQQKKASSVEQKIQIIIEQNKKKDSFIQTYIMGKKLPTNDKEFIIEFLKKYEIQMTGKGINEKLQQDLIQFEKLKCSNYKLLQQLAQVKQKILLYQTVSSDIEGLSKSGEFFDLLQKKTKQTSIPYKRTH